MEINFEETLLEKQGLVWQEIKKYLDYQKNFPTYCAIPKRYASLADFHFKMVGEYPERKGKYLRPALLLLTASAMGFPEKKAIKTAAAMQISEDWILSHDDIEDDSLQRRGKPCLHQIYGKELAINAGDSLHVLMWKILKDNLEAVGEEKGLKIIEEFYWMLNRTTLGQTAEIKWIRENNLKLTDEDILFILESKTGYYSIAGPMRLGAILAGATKKQLDLIYKFGKTLGQCFQIVDDLLDLTSDFRGLKKQTGNDIYEGKRTIMLMHLLRGVRALRLRPAPSGAGLRSGQDRDRVIKILEKTREQKTDEEVRWIIKKMQEYGSLDYGKKLAEKLAEQVLIIFEKELTFLKNQPAREQLKDGINFILKRDF